MVYANSYASGWTASLGITGTETRKRASQLLKEAQKHPTALAHQVAGFLMLDGGVPEVALAEFQQAIALDPGDSWSYRLSASAMIAAGRPAEALPQIRFAMRLDPHPPPPFIFVLGLAQFSLERFEEAAASLGSATRLNPDDEYPFVALAATYGYLGRTQEAKAAIARYNNIKVSRGGVPISIFAAPSLYFWRAADFHRLTKGLRLAGVPHFLISGEFAAKNRLSADDARMVIVGHRLRGRDLMTGEERVASIGADGVGTLSGDWASMASSSVMTGVIVQFKGDDVCYLWRTTSLCGGMFHNPGGTKEQQNEFIWYYPEQVFTFSQVE
jgi:adenylate cyclase